MPKTASKRAQARRTARVARAHQSPASTPVVRRPPLARRRPQKRGLAKFIDSYPWASAFFIVALIGVVVLVAHNQQVGPFAPPKPTPVTQATCDLKTHKCTKAPIMTIDASKTYTATIKTA